VANTENIRKWVDALRSGEYKQTKECLRYNYEEGPRYCCLGVACDISGVGRWEHAEEVGKLAEYICKDDRNAGYMPTEVKEWLGLELGNPPLLDAYGASAAAATFNDSMEDDFLRIADAIERTYLDGE
jgi:hypothetical protein